MLHFGTAGIPTTVKGRGTVEGILEVKRLGLGAMELEFVRNINVSKELAPEVRKTAEKKDIILTCHGQYWVNLNATDAKTLQASVKRVIDAARICWLCGVKSLTYHTAYRMGMQPEKVYENVKKQLKVIMAKLRNEGNNLTIRPENAGRLSQFGSLKECIKLSQDIEGVLPCIDYGHMHAYSIGKYNTYNEFCSMLEELEKGLGKEILRNMHIQVAGIEYNKHGERWHKNLKDSDLNYKDICKSWKEFKVAGVVISESPNIEGDALLLQKVYRG